MKLEELGKKSYEALGVCVERALEEEDSEYATICASGLVHLAKAEGANYFGFENYYNYNTAMELSKEAVKLAEKSGVPDWLKDEVEDIKKALREAGW